MRSMQWSVSIQGFKLGGSGVLQVENLQPTPASLAEASAPRSSGSGQQQSQAAGGRGAGQRVPSGVLQSSQENLELAQTPASAG